MTTPRALALLSLLLLFPSGAGAQFRRGGQNMGPPPRSENDERRPTRHEPAKPDRVIEINVTDEGFEPRLVTAKKGERIRLVIALRSASTSAREFVLDEFLVWRRLTPGSAVVEELTTHRLGEFPFRSADGSASGVLKVEE